MAVQIEVISDVVCPWCYIGKRRLEEALRRLHAGGDAGAVEVAWRPFQLNPDLPEQGIDRAEYLERKFGSASAQIYARVAAVGASVGIRFAFERIARQPNTLPAHQLIALAGELGRQDAMVEALFRAYFIDGEDLTERDALIALAQRVGIDANAAASRLDDPLQRHAAAAADHAARALGVEGVPFFVFDRRLAVSGAQDPDTLVEAIRRAGAQPPALP